MNNAKYDNDFIPTMLGTTANGTITPILVDDNGALVISTTSVSSGAESLFKPSVDIYIDGNRSDTYIADGTINRPYKTLSAAIASNPSTAITIHLAAATYTETTNLLFPNVPIVLYGNGSTLNNTGHTITVQNSNYTRYDLNTIGTVIFNSSAVGRILIQGGSIIGNITCNGLTDFKSVTLTNGTIITNSNAQLLAIVCTITSQISGSGLIILEDNNFNATKSTPLITSVSAGTLLLVGNIVTNLGTGGAVNCANGANGTTRSNSISNNIITVASGAPIACGTAVTFYSKNIVAGGINTGTGFIGINTDIIGSSTIMGLGSDTTGDIYYRNALGLLTRLPLGTNGQTLKSNGTIPYWA
jgi:hypothetical protein